MCGPALAMCLTDRRAEVVRVDPSGGDPRRAGLFRSDVSEGSYA